MSDYSSRTIDNMGNENILPSRLVFNPAKEVSPFFRTIIAELKLIKHKEGGYSREMDRSHFKLQVLDSEFQTSIQKLDSSNERSETRNYSTLIYYLLTPDLPVGRFHKNKNRIIHVLQRGRKQYFLIYPNGTVKSSKVGFDHTRREISQWVVPGGVYKDSFSLPNDEFRDGLLISEVVVPGFEFSEHIFMAGQDELNQLVDKTKANNIKFL